jgi:glycerophosphoryl diester phosphodiesterase
LPFPFNDWAGRQPVSRSSGSWKGAEFAGEKVPTLAEALHTMKGRGLLVIEIKAAGLAGEVVGAVREAGSLGQCVVFSFDGGVVRQVAELEPRLPAIWLLGQVPVEEDDQQELLLEALESRCAALAPHYGALTPGFVRRAHRLGLGLWAWTVDDPAAMRRVAALGADVLITNWPDRAVAVVGERET